MEDLRIVEIDIDGRPIWITDQGHYMDNRNDFIECLCHAHGEFNLKFVDWDDDWEPLFKDNKLSREQIFEIIWKKAKKRS